MDMRKYAEELLLNRICHLISPSEENPEHWIMPLIEIIYDDNYPAESKGEALREVVLNENNPFCIGLFNYEAYCEKDPVEEELGLLEYMKIRELARAYVVMEKYDLAADEISQLFSVDFQEPEKYILLAENCFNCGFTEDAAEAVKAGLEIFPEYLRLKKLSGRMNS